MIGEQAAREVRREVVAGRVDSEAVEAVLGGAGQKRRKRRAGPAGLTPREIEVLVLIARGASNQQVAQTLGITPKTAGTHIERICTKIGASTRSTATLFAVQHGLLDPAAAKQEYSFGPRGDELPYVEARTGTAQGSRFPRRRPPSRTPDHAGTAARSGDI